MIEKTLSDSAFLVNESRAKREHPQRVIINVAAGFISYPYLPAGEVDLPRVVAYKQARVEEFMRQGLIPSRDVSYLPGDLNDPGERKSLMEQLTKMVGGRSSFVILEGISYYLHKDACRKSEKIPCKFQRVCVLFMKHLYN